MLNVTVLQSEERLWVRLRSGTRLQERTWQLAVSPNVLLICENTCLKSTSAFVNKTGGEAPCKRIGLPSPPAESGKTPARKLWPSDLHLEKTTPRFLILVKYRSKTAICLNTRKGLCKLGTQIPTQPAVYKGFTKNWPQIRSSTQDIRRHQKEKERTKLINETWRICAEMSTQQKHLPNKG